MNYSILINTCDKFEDCWDPFFKLFKIYWPDYKGTIYLNTEYKDYYYPDLNIIAIKGCENNNFPRNKRATWSQCLKWAMESIKEDVVLYMQEDYFLKDQVKNELVEKYANLIHDQEDIHCIHLTDQGSPAERPSNYDNLWIVPKKHQDRISCQGALWRKDILLQYIRTYESAWNFEWWGSKRGEVLNHNFFVVDKNWVEKDEFEIIPYIFTGVIGGKWYKEVMPLFKRHNIEIDYSIRGFFEIKRITFKQRIKAKVKRLPIELRNSIDLIMLRQKN